MNKFELLKKWFSEYHSTCRPINKKYIEKDQLFLIAGHRGSPTKEIENTIQSFETAINDGANSLELDLCITKDQKVVIWHDWNPNAPKALLREAGFEPWVLYKPHPPALTNPLRKKISEITYEEFVLNYDYKKRNDDQALAKAEKLQLSDFFKWSEEKDKLKYVFFDIKTPPEEAELALLILKEICSLSSKYRSRFTPIIETFYPEVLEKMKKEFPDFNYGLDEEPDFGFILDPRKFSGVQAAADHHNQYAISFRPRKVTIANWTTYRRIVRYDVKYRYKYNLENPGSPIIKLIGATVNKPKELSCLVKLGIGGIQTDFPHRLREIAIKNERRVE
jgi:glycerophosphoryl diester phosphodiesterase